MVRYTRLNSESPSFLAIDMYKTFHAPFSIKILEGFGERDTDYGKAPQWVSQLGKIRYLKTRKGAINLLKRLEVKYKCELPSRVKLEQPID